MNDADEGVRESAGASGGDQTDSTGFSSEDYGISGADLFYPGTGP